MNEREKVAKMSDRVVRGWTSGPDKYELWGRPCERWTIRDFPMEDDVQEVTILLHDGDKVGPFEPWMVEVLDGVLFVLRDLIASGTTNLEETGELLKIRAALGSLWKEGE